MDGRLTPAPPTRERPHPIRSPPAAAVRRRLSDRAAAPVRRRIPRMATTATTTGSVSGTPQTTRPASCPASAASSDRGEPRCDAGAAYARRCDLPPVHPSDSQSTHLHHPIRGCSYPNSQWTTRSRPERFTPVTGDRRTGHPHKISRPTDGITRSCTHVDGGVHKRTIAAGRSGLEPRQAACKIRHPRRAATRGASPPTAARRCRRRSRRRRPSHRRRGWSATRSRPRRRRGPP